MLAIPSLVPAPLLAQSVPLSPLVILVLCVIAGVGTVLLLPSRREASLRKVGGAILLAAEYVDSARGEDRRGVPLPYGRLPFPAQLFRPCFGAAK